MNIVKNVVRCWRWFVGPKRPKRGDKMRVKSSSAEGTVMRAKSNGWGDFETWMTVLLKFPDGSTAKFTENQLEFVS